MDIPRIHVVRESGHRIHNPITAEKLAALGQALRLGPDATALDLGSGSGELLCTWARDHGLTGTGVDLCALFTKQARARAVELGVADRVRFVHADAAGHVSDSLVDLAACVGATWIGGGVDGTVELLARSLRPGGIILIGEPYWRQTPPDRQTAELCEATSVDDFRTLPDLLAHFGDLGYDVVEMMLADQDSWDRYQAAQWLTMRSWLDAHPDDELADQVRAELSAEHTTYELGKEYRDMDAVGHANIFKGTLSYPIIRGQDQNLWFSAEGAYKRITDKINVFDQSTRKRIFSGTAALQYERWIKIFDAYRLYTSLGGSFTYGNLGFADDADRAANRAGADTAGGFSYVNVNATINYSLTETWSINMLVKAQHTFDKKNLDGNEQFIISGPGGVRAYRETVSGDKGYFMNGEVRYKLPEFVTGWKHSAGLFAGMGRSRCADDGYTTSNGETLYDVGLGYYANYRLFFAKVQVAQIVGPRPDGLWTGGRTQVLGHVGITF